MEEPVFFVIASHLLSSTLRGGWTGWGFTIKSGVGISVFLRHDLNIWEWEFVWGDSLSGCVEEIESSVRPSDNSLINWKSCCKGLAN